MELLSVGVLARTVMVGAAPGELTVQVLGNQCRGPSSLSPPQILALKPLKSTSTQRLKVWDGCSVLTHAVLDLSSSPGLQVPAVFSVVRLEGVKTKKMPEEKGAREQWAVISSGYTMVRPGEKVGRKLEPSTAGQRSQGRQVLHGAGEATPPVTGPSTCHPTPAKARGSQVPRHGNHVKRNGNHVKRNLAQTFGQPVAKRPAMQETHQVAQIAPYTNRYTLRVRVTQMGIIRRITTKYFSGLVLDCILTDSSGHIKLTGWALAGCRFVVDMARTLEEGGTYLITGPAIKPVQDTTYNNTGHDYELTWTELTRVVGPLTANTVQFNYKCVSLGEVVFRATDSVVDVLGLVRYTGECMTFTDQGGKELTTRELTLCDQRGKVTLTLWAAKAKRFSYPGRVVVVRGAKVRESQGRKSLELQVTGSYEVEPAVAGVAELVKWASRQKGGGAGSHIAIDV